MLCSVCGCETSRIIDTRRVDCDGECVIERYRKCVECGYPWRTHEKVKPPETEEDD
jgi:transcriptional regulator NrdR family protein